ncbi:MAG: Mur ligase family protein [Patescibacteria group bacterium]|nr:Mur ligase family protein [Patescibacteria group bacterium]
MNNFLNKFLFFWKRPKIIVVTGQGRTSTIEAISQTLKQYFKVDGEIFLSQADLTEPSEIKKFEFLVEKSKLPILVVTHFGEIPFDKDFFAGDRKKALGIRKLAKALPPYGYLILNFDDETVREIKDITNLNELTFGFGEGANLRATDVKLNNGTNFKINYKGNIVPVWLEKIFGKEQIYSALAAAAVGMVLDLNLVEISQALKNYQSLPGKMKLIEGIKNSWILDDSESATVFSMVEALGILKELRGFKRKIAVLGDIIGIGKYTIEAHEAIGEKVAEGADLLFTFGSRAKFIAQGAYSKGMAFEKIFQFDTIDEGKLKLQDEIKEGDLILVDGSKEMEMGKIVEEIKAQLNIH